MDFKVGDRVISLINNSSGLHKGELGCVIEVQANGVPIIRWDNFNRNRHSADNRTENGHGWFIFRKDAVELVQEMVDLGDLPEANMDAKNILFGL